MVSGGRTESGIDNDWRPTAYAISFERFSHPKAGGRGSLVASHPTAPFGARFPEGASPSDALMQRIGFAYLSALNEWLKDFGHPKGLDLPAGWLEALDPETPGRYFRWLMIEPPFPACPEGQDFYSTLSSYRLLRTTSQAKRETHADTTIVLVAAEVLLEDGRERAIGSDFGLRVMMHLLPGDDDQQPGRASVVGMTAHLPYEPYKTLAELEQALGPEELKSIVARYREFLDEKVLASVDPRIAAQHQLGSGLVYSGLRFLKSTRTGGEEPPIQLDVSGTGLGALSSDQAVTSYGFLTRVAYSLNGGSQDWVTRPIARYPLITDAEPAGSARIFEQDPPSWRDLDNLAAPTAPYDWRARRPTRGEDRLDGFRRLVGIGAQELVPLETEDFVVRNCPRFVHDDPDNEDPKEVRLPSDVWPPVRADDHSAISAFWTCSEVYETMRALGLDPAAYFQATQRKIHVFYRSGISPGRGKSGQTINARVKIVKEGEGFQPGDLPKIEIHLALANLSHRARWVPGDLAPTWAEPLGIATSERWLWHEFGHVMIAARLEKLEFEFAHSVGDGLAAVWADPFSRLADPRGVPSVFRGITFPWVYLNRRHDRCVLKGWSWGGTFQRPVINAPERNRRGFKGYLSEQILSSTLFRLYRILGGDTLDVVDSGPDYDTRQTASLATLFLILRGIETFAQSPTRAEELEAALIDADSGLSTPLALSLRSGTLHEWQGGLAHKAVRWAFEAQGMHAPDAQVIHNAPGAPPAVDVYIEDKRPLLELADRRRVRHGPGGYVPVSLDWAGEPLWQGYDPGGPLDSFAVTVRNRGDQDAMQVSARAWFGWAKGDPSTGGWDRAAVIDWLPAISLQPASQSVPAGGEASFSAPGSPSAPPPAGSTKLILLIEATCPDDRANSDPAAGLPCAVPTSPPVTPRALTDLVANDNNLGLWMTDAP